MEQGLYSAMYAQSLIYSNENTNNRDLFIQMVTIVRNLVDLYRLNDIHMS